MAVCSLTLFACNKKTEEHTHSENCQHEHVEAKESGHTHGEDCNHDHHHDHNHETPTQESFSVESESN